MIKYSITLLIFLIVISFSACEKDDICVDGDTPLVIIRFYDSENPTEFKTVPSLRVVGFGNDSVVDTFTDRISTLDSIGIPFKTFENNTSFIFTKDSADEDNLETGTSDTLSFTYTPQETFVSRACGYITNYDDLATDFITSEDHWIQSIEISKTSVKTEETVTAHVKIYH